MSRFPIQTDTPPEPTVEGDSRFVGLHMWPERESLQPGQYADGLNKRCRGGRVTKRGGSFLPAFANAVVYGAIVGAGIYADPRGPRQMIIATPGKVYSMTSGAPPVEIPLPEGESLSRPVNFVQRQDKLLLLRGINQRPMEWTGRPTDSFELVTKRIPEDTSTEVLPNIERGVGYLSRFLFPIEDWKVGVTDIADDSSYDPILANFPANSQGVSGSVTALFPYPGGIIIIGKEDRIENLSGWTDPTHPELAASEVLSSSLGIWAWDTCRMVNGDLLALSRQGGIVRVFQPIQDRVSVAPLFAEEPDPILPLIERINWEAARGAVAEVLDEYYVIALPIDGAEFNNCLAWYNFKTREWEGYDLWPEEAGMQIDRLLLFDYLGARRLYAVNFGAASIHLLNEGKMDETRAGTFPIADRFLSRGYATLGWNAATRRDFRRAEVAVQTWAPEGLRISEVTDQLADVRVLLPEYRRDPRKWRTWNRAPYRLYSDPRPHHSPGRQDYAFTLPADGVEFSLENVNLEMKQADVLSFATKTAAPFVSVQIESAGGDVEIGGILLESAGVQRGAPRRAA